MWHNLVSPNLEKGNNPISSIDQKFVSTLIQNIAPLQVVHQA